MSDLLHGERTFGLTDLQESTRLHGLEWPDVKAEFDWDGGLRDLYVLQTDMEAWQVAWELLQASVYPLIYTIDGEKVELPTSVETIFKLHEEACYCLSVDVHGMSINCHFFLEDQIEFDIDPREVNSEGQFVHVCRFIQNLGQALDRDVILSHEDSTQSEGSVFIRYLPGPNQFQYRPVGIIYR